ncbi:MAG: hypothetical protein GYA55_12795 [SAR324 cluster bacterium]|uniref:Glycosyl transferase CAP10 domain-containing protein n=1 Tax=SAR324 cluster bacterium TaxID=2024889 RepID=A0A7X9IKF2_9DELT|nr:hypothetical protein [SAR324 cluster bacterium]
MINSIALNYWKLSGYSKEDIDSVMAELDNYLMAARVEFRENNNIHISITHKVEERQEGHAPTMIRFIHELACTYASKQLRGSVIFWLEDGMWHFYERFTRRAPILAFGRRCEDYRTMLIPDPAFLGARGYQAEIDEISEIEKTLTWSCKTPTIFWRGATTGMEIDTDKWKEVPRIKLAMKSKEINDPDRVDAYISYVTKLSPSRMQEIRDLGIVKPYCKFNDFLKYRYLVDVDGYSCAWKSLFLKLASQSLVLKTDSPFMQWYYDKLIPWVNYIPLRSDYEDIEEVFEWLSSHDNDAKQIADNGAKLARSISYADALKDTADLLENLLSCQKSIS